MLCLFFFLSQISPSLRSSAPPSASACLRIASAWGWRWVGGYLLEKTIQGKTRLIFPNYSRRPQVFLQTQTPPQRSSHVVSLQPEVLIIIKTRLISKRTGAARASPLCSSAPCDPAANQLDASSNEPGKKLHPSIRPDSQHNGAGLPATAHYPRII